MTHSIDRKHFNHSKANGLAAEQYVINELKSRMNDVQPSSRHENVVLDIDVYVNGKPCSIKSHKHDPKYPAAIFLEKQVQFADGSWHDSWFINGKAEYYYTLIHQGSLESAKLYHIAKKALLEWLTDHPDEYRTKTLSPRVRASQEAGGHKHVNALNCVVPIQKLIDARVAHEVT